MATQAPTFGLDGSELDVMDGLFFNELTDLPVEPAHNQTLFAQPKSEPPITDEELIASFTSAARGAGAAAGAAARLQRSRQLEVRRRMRLIFRKRGEHGTENTLVEAAVGRN